MIIFKATQLTLKDLNVKPETIEDTDSFFSWHVNFLRYMAENIMCL